MMIKGFFFADYEDISRGNMGSKKSKDLGDKQTGIKTNGRRCDGPREGPKSLGRDGTTQAMRELVD